MVTYTFNVWYPNNLNYVLSQSTLKQIDNSPHYEKAEISLRGDWVTYVVSVWFVFCPLKNIENTRR